jgi:hypothetical protein
VFRKRKNSAVAAGSGIVGVMFGAEEIALAVSLAIRAGLLFKNRRRTGEVRARNHGALAEGGRCIRHAGPAARGVLFMNLKSGGRAGTPACGRAAGAGSSRWSSNQADWFQRVRDAAASGVDVLGMAGGDGSQAMVATIAAESGCRWCRPGRDPQLHSSGGTARRRGGRADAYGDAVERRLISPT